MHLIKLHLCEEHIHEVLMMYLRRLLIRTSKIMKMTNLVGRQHQMTRRVQLVWIWQSLAEQMLTVQPRQLQLLSEARPRLVLNKGF
jgi:hypothetical protein